MKELIEKIARSLVDNPDAVSVNEVEGEHSVVLELKVAQEDMGKVIGRSGTHAEAIRTIVRAIGGKKGRRYLLEILE
jgi:predicted RNA-binding protein YlqC (UPF0109 family)